MPDNSCSTIRTPEGVVFHLYPAGLPRRAAAMLIDVLMLTVIASTVNKVLPLFALFNTALSYALIIVFDFIFGLLYWMVSEWLWQGRTVGKRLMHIRVVDSSGLKLTLPQIIIRNLFRSVDFLPILYIAGSICCFFDRRTRRLGDIAAGTMVVRDTFLSAPDLESILPEKYNSLRSYSIEAARMRDKISPDESNLLLEALRRRNQLEPRERYGVYAALARYFKSKAKFPENALDGMSDEKFLINVADILYRN